MTTRTIPTLFPRVRDNELFSRKLYAGGLLRKMTQSHNWIWSKATRVYANHAYEGLGNFLFHFGSTFYQNTKVLVTAPDGGTDVLPLVSFLVPPNWGYSKRVKIQGQTQFATALTSSWDIIAAVYDLDDVYVGQYIALGVQNTPGTSTWNVTLQVPQNKTYQVKVFLRFTDTSTAAANTFAELALVNNISARYAAAIAEELGNETPQATWSPIADEAFNAANMPVHAGLLQRLNRNTNHMMSYRGAELCQAFLGVHYNNDAVFREIGRYVVYLPDMVTEIQGKLVMYCTSGGVGNEVRILVDGVVKQTFTALAAGESTLVVAAIACTSNAEHTITIEAISTATASLLSTTYGTICNGVSIWESAITQGLPVGSAVPANFAPLDEAGMHGDDAISWGTNAKAELNGVQGMIQNDRWLAANRLRHLIGDWRHRTYKRVARLSAPNTNIFDARVDWTRGPESVAYQLYRQKNITIRGTSSAEDDADSIGNFSGQDAVYIGSYTDVPFIHPNDMTFTTHGRRLAKHQMVRPTGVRTHMREGGNWICMVRGRRLRPDSMAVDSNSWGTTAEEPPYVDKGYFQALYNAVAAGSTIPIKSKAKLADYEKHWCPPLRGAHLNSDNTFTIRGRLPSQPGAVDAGGAALGATRPEGMLFEIELCSMYLADEPLNEEILRSL